MSLIIGVDPGSRKTGFGVIETVSKSSSQIKYVTSGVIRLPSGPLPVRLGVIFDNISQLIDEFNPQQMAIEEVFLARDPSAAIKLGQARGVILLGLTRGKLPIGEYSPNQIKKSLSGYGHASKDQIIKMLSHIFPKVKIFNNDSGDALAIAICHLMNIKFLDEKDL